MKLSFWQSLIRSSSDFKFYREIFYQSTGKTIKYLLLFSILITTVLGIRYTISLNAFSKKAYDWLKENVPQVEINKGIVSVDIEQPFTYTEKDFAVVIDTTGEVTSLDPTYKAGVLLTKTSLFIRHDQTRTEEIKLDKIDNFKVDKDSVKKWFGVFTKFVIPFIIILQFVYLLFAKIVQASLASLFTIAFRQNVTYRHMFNICIYALTPATILAAVVILFMTKPLPLFFILYIGMYIAFIYGGLKQCTIEEGKIDVVEEGKAE